MTSPHDSSKPTTRPALPAIPSFRAPAKPPHGEIRVLCGVRAVAGIEVYRGPSELPAEFGGSVGRCGAIVIWTGPAGFRGTN